MKTRALKVLTNEDIQNIEYSLFMEKRKNYKDIKVFVKVQI